MMAARQLDWQPNMAGVRGRLRADEPMSAHTSWRLGGPADWYFVPADKSDLCRFIQQLPEEIPVYWIGLGSNLLVRDGGIRGVVIGALKGLGQLKLVDDCRVLSQAGVASAQVARFCGRNHLAGAEFLAGIPGSFGGALAMNAGAFGGEIFDVVESVELIDRQGDLKICHADEFSPSYRQVKLPEQHWFISATLCLTPGDKDQSKNAVQSLLKRRAESQPIQSANAGSVFRNPPGNYAAKLIEMADLKGLRYGGAEVSAKHANFIVNRGDASATDVEQLILLIQQQVQKNYDVCLQTEVRITGEPA
ncbi:MAG: UDP-N-acetylmuramate dehydrogenase [Parasphingorhabdus sp.]|jgi:UDP-N-acetylmuramate dehydrogenase